MMKKVDLFMADKMMSTRTSEFMNTKVWGIVLKERYKKDLEKLENKLTQWEEEAKTGTEDNKIFAEQVVVKTKAEIIDLQKKYEEQRQKEAIFTYTDNDKTFYKLYTEATDENGIRKAIRQWFAPYKLVSIENTTLENAIVDAIAGERRANAKTIITSGATKFTQTKRTKNDVLGLFYGKLSEFMLEAGTLKPTEIPEDIRNIYVPKKKEKANKKSK